MRFLYTSFVHTYFLLITFVGIFHKKARLFSQGRKRSFTKFPKINRSNTYWFHCASLGEFEQARPVIEKIKETDASIGIVVTFFSPSGFEIRKNYEYADYVGYLPPDLNGRINPFLDHFNPSKVFFVKYEFWYNTIRALKVRNIPMFLISGIFREDQYFFKPWGKWFLKHLRWFDHLFLQENNSKFILLKNGFQNITVAGDTRFDRVHAIANHAPKIPAIEHFISERKAFIIGSNWPEDDKILLPLLADIDSEFCFIIAPHNLSENTFKEIEEKCSFSTIRYSALDENETNHNRALIIDNMGMLSFIYQYGILAYIGGGFGANVHNVLEAATWGLPTIFGPNNKKFHEIQELKRIDAAFEIANQNELQNILTTLIADHQLRESASKKAKKYIEDHRGATELIIAEAVRN